MRGSRICGWATAGAAYGARPHVRGCVLVGRAAPNNTAKAIEHMSTSARPNRPADRHIRATDIDRARASRCPRRPIGFPLPVSPLS